METALVGFERVGGRGGASSTRSLPGLEGMQQQNLRIKSNVVGVGSDDIDSSGRRHSSLDSARSTITARESMQQQVRGVCFLCTKRKNSVGLGQEMCRRDLEKKEGAFDFSSAFCFFFFFPTDLDKKKLLQP